MKLFSLFIDKFKNLDKKVYKIMHIGFTFSFVICIIAILLLFTYETLYSLPTLFYYGISLFRTAIMFVVMFAICAIGFDTIKKQIT